MTIFVAVSGGFGNQFFQCGFAYHLSELTGTSISLEVSEYLIRSERTTYRESYSSVLLPHYQEVNLGLNQIIEKFYAINPQIKSRVFRKANFYHRTLKLLFRHRILVLTKFPKSVSKFLKFCPVSICFVGTWQDSKYIHQAYTKHLIAKLNEVLSYRDFNIPNNAIGVHVRKTDYLNQNSIHADLELSYYDNALAVVSSTTDPLPIVVFTDDRNWCASNFVKFKPIYFAEDSVGAETLINFLYMTKFKNLVIANSSFSFSAALCADPDTVVVAPKKWFKSPAQNLSSKYPASWTSL